MSTYQRVSIQAILGLSIIAIGVLFTLDNLDIIYARDYLRYWPALLVLVGLVQLSQPRGNPGKIMGIILVSLGSLMLLDRFDIINFSFWDLWPVIIIIFGFSLLRGARNRRASWWSLRAEPDSDAYVRGMAILGGYSRRNNSPEFRGGELTAVMGGCELDLRAATMKDNEATIDIFAFWGGVSIKVPEDWTVAINVVPIMGGVEDTTRPPKPDKIKRLTITGYAIMGGAEIKN
jgi:predicted membrane protein